jgi:hypothetical protein
LRLLFKPDYVTRSRQGSSTFSGTFAAPGKIVTGVAGAPIKGVGFAAHGVGKGASFIRHGFKSKKKDEEDADDAEAELEAEDNAFLNTSDLSSPGRAAALTTGPSDISAPITPPDSAAGSTPHSRSKSFGATSLQSTIHGGAPSASTGTASFTILSAVGYPPSSNVMVYVKQLGSKPKTIHKTDHIKSSSGTVTFNDKKESFKCSCSADTQLQVQVKGHNTFGSDDDLGEGLFFVDDSGTGLEKNVKAGSGHVVLKSNFVLTSTENGLGDNSPKSNSFRKSLLSKRENGKNSRDVTPTPQ